MSSLSFILTAPCISQFTRCTLSKSVSPSHRILHPYTVSPRCTATPPSPNDSPESPALPTASTDTTSTQGNEIAFVGADRLGISFTCSANGCGQRVTKSIRRHSYEKGTVLIQCPGCGSHHVIADNFGMYTALTGGKKNVEEIAQDSGTTFVRVGTDAFGLDNVYREFLLLSSF